ncbi:MAG: TetR/AcrR family transcriptional regulator [Actinomycetota bacterium]
MSSAARTASTQIGRSKAVYHHGDLAAALVAEAYKRVQVGGAETVSLRGVAQAVGVTASAAYHHFADKNALLYRVCVLSNDELDQRVLTAMRKIRGHDWKAASRRLRAIGMAYIDFAHDEPQLFRHTFGPYACPPENSQNLSVRPKTSKAFEALCQVLDDLDNLSALHHRAGLDLLAWAAVHGFATLMIDQLITDESARTALLDSLHAIAVRPPE